MNKLKHTLLVCGIIAIICVVIQPIHSRPILLLLAALWFVVIGSSVALMKNYKQKVLACICVLLPLLPLVNQGEVNPKDLTHMYVENLKSSSGIEYVWGGEGWMGLDCSGLPRRSMIKALFKYTYLKFNGQALIACFDLWINDASAKEFLNGYGGRVVVDGTRYKINSVRSDVKAGDIAVTYGGVHVMAYLDKQTIIQAEPERSKVVIDKIPCDNSWYDADVCLIRWKIGS